MAGVDGVIAHDADEVFDGCDTPDDDKALAILADLENAA